MSQAIVIGERTRHTKNIDDLVNLRISEMWISLEAVVNVCVDFGKSTETLFDSLLEEGLCHPTDYRVTHMIGEEACRRAEALLIPSCTRIPGGNLIIFTDCLRPNSSIEVIGAIDPELRLPIP